MSIRPPQALAQPLDATGSAPQPSPAARLIEHVFRAVFGRLDCGELIVETPGGTRVHLRGETAGPQARINIHTWRLLPRLIADTDIGFAEGYMDGQWSTPDLAALLDIAGRCEDAAVRLKFLRLPRVGMRLRHAFNRNSRRGSRRNIAAHYDLGNSFYAPWLDAGMSYSSALYATENQPLEDAQNTKLDRVLAMLDPRDGDRVLEIGCGWGSFAERLLARHACTLTGLTLSTEQLDYARGRLARPASEGRCDLRLQDYRDVAGTFDRIASIEMLEAVGEAYWPVYFDTLRERLRPGGVAVLQVITIAQARYAAYRRRPDFIQKYIFPGGMLPTVDILERQVAGAGLQMTGMHHFGKDYARTLMEWKRRFLAAWPQIAPLGFDERFRRMWDYYLAYCQTGFGNGALDVGLYRIERPATASA